MESLIVNGKKFIPYISAEEIQQKCFELAAKINRDFKNEHPLFICILNGSFIFAADLFRLINIEAEISFIKLASYKGTSSSGNVITAIGLDERVKDRNIIILEDILDTGRTLYQFLPEIYNQNPKSLKIVSLLTKPSAKIFDIKADYFGFEIPDKFVLGYGLDFDGLGRNIPEIYQLEE
ncbi:MAG TPA: hypoxanthine phosphoribosyltransferase [Edaphocola sp.]|nr:hypoxanthine phosphoribosyltransferase [Edaphocola sp.]